MALQGLLVTLIAASMIACTDSKTAPAAALVLPTASPVLGLRRVPQLSGVMPVDVFAQFYGFEHGDTRPVLALHFIRASYQSFGRGPQQPNPPPDAPNSVTEVLATFNTEREAGGALKLLLAREREALAAGPAPELSDLPQRELGDEYGWGLSAKMTLPDGATLFRAEYSWRRGTSVVTVLAFHPTAIPTNVGAIAADLDRQLADSHQ